MALNMFIAALGENSDHCDFYRINEFSPTSQLKGKILMIRSFHDSTGLAIETSSHIHASTGLNSRVVMAGARQQTN
ncbi:hypothetical protein TNCV_4945041 [Trichonephila clavipes]|nr:hypothetical protein TNCV_4945041 [Trichonephila clavipes]